MFLSGVFDGMAKAPSPMLGSRRRRLGGESGVLNYPAQVRVLEALIRVMMTPLMIPPRYGLLVTR